MSASEQLPSPTPGGGTRASRAVLDDALAAALWVIVTVPPSFGFWLVAGELAGVSRAATKTLIAASLLAVGIATLLQVLAGYRLPVFEGPASIYLAAVAVIHASSHRTDPRSITGGLVAAAGLAFVLGALRADRLIKRLFTPAVVSAFLVIVVIAVAPDAAKALIGRTAHHPFGVAAAWVSAALVILIAVAGQRVRPLRAYSLLVALVVGSGVYFALAGGPARGIDARWTTPSLFPWGAPHLTLAIAAPFLVSALLASFNTVASVNVMAATLGRPARADEERRGITIHGIAQGLTACLGNLTGHVPRLDSVGVVRLVDNASPRALAIAALATVALAFLSPLTDVLAMIPAPVSAALLAFVLALLVLQGLRQLRALDARKRWLVFVPALLPAFAWLAVGSSLPETVQLVANPLLVGVVVGVVLDFLVGPTSSPRM